jgi:hypothetical protein
MLKRKTSAAEKKNDQVGTKAQPIAIGSYSYISFLCIAG